VFGRRGEIARFAAAAIREDGALVQFAVAAVAARLATLSPQGVERGRQQRLTRQAGFEQVGEKLLSLEQLGAEGTETLVHGVTVIICRSLNILTYRVEESSALHEKKIEKKEKNGSEPRTAIGSRLSANAQCAARKPEKDASRQTYGPGSGRAAARRRLLTSELQFD
jgi:hypothetical protein